MDNINITQIPVEFIDEHLADKTKFKLSILYEIKKKFEDKKHEETYISVCRELHENGIFVGTDTKVFLETETIRHYYYTLNKKKPC